MEWLIGKRVASLGGHTHHTVPVGLLSTLVHQGVVIASVVNPTRMPRESGSILPSPTRLFDSEGFRSPLSRKEVQSEHFFHVLTRSPQYPRWQVYTQSFWVMQLYLKTSPRWGVCFLLPLHPHLPTRFDFISCERQFLGQE